jgi:hypothetical protein
MASASGSSHGHPGYSPTFRAIGMLEIVGGVTGCATVVWFYLSGHEGGMPAGNVPLTLLPFGILTTAGIALIRSQQFGLRLSLAMQACQALAWTAWGTMWRFSAGPFLSVTLFADKTTIFAGWDTSFRLETVAADAPVSLTLNVIPILLGIVLWRRQRVGHSVTPPHREDPRTTNSRWISGE